MTLMNNAIVSAWSAIEPDSAAYERMLNGILKENAARRAAAERNRRVRRTAIPAAACLAVAAAAVTVSRTGLLKPQTDPAGTSPYVVVAPVSSTAPSPEPPVTAGPGESPTPSAGPVTPVTAENATPSAETTTPVTPEDATPSAELTTPEAPEVTEPPVETADPPAEATEPVDPEPSIAPSIEPLPTPSTEPFFLGTEPLTPYPRGHVGTGAGPAQPAIWYYTDSADELRAYLDLEEDLELPDYLPVYRDLYPVHDPYFVATQEEKDAWEQQAKDFLIDMGRGDLVDAGLKPNAYFWNQDSSGVYLVDFLDPYISTISSQGRGIVVGVKIPGLQDMDGEAIRELIDTEPALRSACRYSGITDPEVLISPGKGAEWYIDIIQHSDDPIQSIINRGLPHVVIRLTSDSEYPDKVQILAGNPKRVELMGWYPVGDLEDIKRALIDHYDDYSLLEEEIAAFAIEYRDGYYTGLYVPCLSAYYEVGYEKHYGTTSYGPGYAAIVTDPES